MLLSLARAFRAGNLSAFVDCHCAIFHAAEPVPLNKHTRCRVSAMNRSLAGSLSRDARGCDFSLDFEKGLGVPYRVIVSDMHFIYSPHIYLMLLSSMYIGRRRS